MGGEVPLGALRRVRGHRELRFRSRVGVESMSKILFANQHGVSERRSIQGGQPILVLGPFPSPVHGFSQATMEIANLFEAAGYSVTCIDLKPVRGPMGLWSSLQVRLRQV